MKNWMYIIILLAGILIYPSATVMAADYSATISSLSEQLIADPSPPPLKFVDISFDLLNNTGQTWTDFHMDLRSGYGEHFTPPASTYDGPGSATLSNEIFSGFDFGPNTALDVIGLNILNGATYSFMVDINFGEGGWALSGHPSVGSTPPPTPTPEPATILLLGFGLAGIAGLRRKFSN